MAALELNDRKRVTFYPREESSPMHVPHSARLRNLVFALITAGSALLITAATVFADSGSGPFPR